MGEKRYLCDRCGKCYTVPTEEPCEGPINEEEKTMKFVIRRCLRDFAELMEHKLRAKDHRGKRGWISTSPTFLLGRMQQETNELVAALIPLAGRGTRIPKDSFERTRLLCEARKVCEEAADVANFAMMLWDVTREQISELEKADV